MVVRSDTQEGNVEKDPEGLTIHAFEADEGDHYETSERVGALWEHEKYTSCETGNHGSIRLIVGSGCFVDGNCLYVLMFIFPK